MGKLLRVCCSDFSLLPGTARQDPILVPGCAAARSPARRGHRPNSNRTSSRPARSSSARVLVGQLPGGEGRGLTHAPRSTSPKPSMRPRPAARPRPGGTTSTPTPTPGSSPGSADGSTGSSSLATSAAARTPCQTAGPSITTPCGNSGCSPPGGSRLSPAHAPTLRSPWNSSTGGCPAPCAASTTRPAGARRGTSQAGHDRRPSARRCPLRKPEAQAEPEPGYLDGRQPRSRAICW
jgi:hypothetical protein